MKLCFRVEALGGGPICSVAPAFALNIAPNPTVVDPIVELPLPSVSEPATRLSVAFVVLRE